MPRSLSLSHAIGERPPPSSPLSSPSEGWGSDTPLQVPEQLPDDQGSAESPEPPT